MCARCNSVAGPSQAAVDSGCAWACWALLPSRGQKRCFETVGEFIGDLVHVFPICSTSFFFLYEQNRTSSTSNVRGSRLLRSPYAAVNLPATALCLESARGQGPRERQGCGRRTRARAEQKFSGYWTRDPSHAGSLLKGTRSLSPSLGQGPGREKNLGSRVGEHAFRVPQKFSGCKGTSPGVFISLSPY